MRDNARITAAACGPQRAGLRQRGPRAAAWWARGALLALGTVSLAAALPPAQARAEEGIAALAPMSAPLLPHARSDGSEVTLTPEAAPAKTLIDATPAGPVSEQGAEATVLADHVTLDSQRRLEAGGGVVVWYQGTRLVAPRIIYDGRADRIYVEGPINLSRPAERGTGSEAVLIADAAELDGDLRAGLLRGARLVLARELQFAAGKVWVIDQGRRTVLDNVIASACNVCAAHPTPIWAVRARRITHDATTHKLRIEQPRFLAFGVPILALPMAITAPDPSVERMTGFLRPVLRTTSKLGVGIKLPWFKTLGDSADLTLTPYLSFSRTATLEARYRQAFGNGALEWQGAVSRDDIRKGRTRGYSFGAAEFALSDRTTLFVQQQWASDRTYLSDYGISDPDRLWSGADLEHVTDDTLVQIRGGHYQTLREDEDQTLIPSDIIDAEWTRRFQPATLGGVAHLGIAAHAHRRSSHDDILGRDVARLSFSADWQRSEVLPGGVVAAVETRLDADLWQVRQDSSLRRHSSRVTPQIALELRWPLVRAGAGASQVLEPVVKVAWSPRRDDAGIPNDDSLYAELDEGNLFALDHLPGRDRRDSGLRAMLGLGWTRLDAGGGSLGLLAGRVLYDRAAPAFAGTPLEGRQSDWLLAANLQRPSGLAAVGRALVDSHGHVSRSDMRLGVLRPELQLSAGYSQLAPASGIDRRQQITVDASWQLAESWWAEAGSRYDIDAGRPQRTSLGLIWRTDCVTLAARLKREHDTPASSTPQTEFDLSVRLGGFGRSPDRPGSVAQRSCMR